MEGGGDECRSRAGIRVDRGHEAGSTRSEAGLRGHVCADGSPNLSPKGTTTVWEDERQLVFADISSPTTVRNLRVNPAIEINVVDPFVRKGYRFKGTASLHHNDAIYERTLALLTERGYRATPDRVKTIVLVNVERAAPLISPAYDTGASETTVRNQWIDYHRKLNVSRTTSTQP
jgi:predicted pyridoxine 5'-phosphate oxidase superfamily flavin-nucleotide-binding protein